MPNNFQKQFADRVEPIGGSPAKGVREWGVDKYGRLIGNNDHIWTPGENQAVCRVEQAGSSVLPNFDPMSLYTYTDPFGRPYTGHSHSPKIGCTGVEPHCVCGFYAYYDRRDAPETGAVGVIEGYGLVTQGSLGFRSMKARVLALVLTDKLSIDTLRVGGIAVQQFGFPATQVAYDKPTPSTPAQVMRNYPDVKFFNSVSDMYAEFPPDEAPLYDPDEEGFWSKPIG